MYGRQNAQATSSHHAEHSGENSIFVHQLYGSLMLTQLRRLTSPISSIQILGSPVAPYKLVVRSRKRTSYFITSWGILWRKRQFRTPFVRICTVHRWHTPYLNHWSCKHYGESRTPPYTRCTVAKTHNLLHHIMGNILAKTVFLYTSCTDLHSSRNSDALRHPLAVYRFLEIP